MYLEYLIELLFIASFLIILWIFLNIVKIETLTVVRNLQHINAKNHQF